MSADVVIRAEGLGKKYTIGRPTERARYTALRDVLARNARNMSRTLNDVFRGRFYFVPEANAEFWALKDVNFKIQRGDVVGIVGRNGAGKSTLLKILSRITEPTEGRAIIKGRVASLLEVGTGFHPELTGRENIFLNGAVLGMARSEIKRKFEEIVEFAEVEQFLDTPVKRYSSGMYVRLAFAVAAHLEPEVLVVDEVLAVGDAEFQKKCLGKMGRMSGEGRTVLFVSHNMNAISRLCRSAILLRIGQPAVHFEAAQDAITEYLKATDGKVALWRNDGSIKNRAIEIISFEIQHKLLQTLGEPSCVEVLIKAKVLKRNDALQLAIALYSQDGSLLYITSQFDTDKYVSQTLPEGPAAITVALPTYDLNEGVYTVALSAMLHNQETLFDLSSGPKLTFTVERDYSVSPFWDRRRLGYLAPTIVWRIQAQEPAEQCP